MSSSLKDIALAYLASGLAVLPARLKSKRPAVPTWDQYRGRLPSRTEIEAWFANPQEALCIVAGDTSGNTEMLDFDCAGTAFDAWCRHVQQAAPDLLDRLVIESTPSGGWHVIYRCLCEVCGNTVLARRRVAVSASGPVSLYGKTYKPTRDAHGGWYVILTLIETRGEGGIFLCAPSVGYELYQGDLVSLPIISEAERDLLLDAAWSLNEYVPDVVDGPKNANVAAHVPAAHGSPATARPGDDFNARGDVRGLLEAHGWTLVRSGENEYWRRPGKTAGWSATLKNNVMFVFSSNASPFEPNRGYSPFAVYAWLEHNGDFATAAAALRTQGFGEPVTECHDVDLSGFQVGSGGIDPPDAGPQDPGLLPIEMLRVPGFVSEVMDHTLETAMYPNPTMAFCGAMALQATLAGRKVRDPGDNRTNLYLLGLAHSSVGKDQARKVNKCILFGIGMGDALAERMASGEGLEDALSHSPSLLAQTDEIDTMLQAMGKSKDGRYESMMAMLLTMYSSANSIYTMRRKAGQQSPGRVNQPNLVLFGTAIPNHYYSALSERMLTNGLFARTIVVESANRAARAKPGIIKPPERVMCQAKWWADFRPGPGNLQDWNPDPVVIPYSPEADEALEATYDKADAEYAKAEQASDPIGTTVWGRVGEQVRKLALLYTISENPQAREISRNAVEWASRFILHQVRRMLFMAAGHVAENPFHADCLKVTQRLHEAPGQQLAHSVLLKRMKMDAKKFVELISTLEQSGDIETVLVPRAGTPAKHYRLVKREGQGET